MENQPEVKWYQKPTSIIILLIIFFPIGLYLMWKNELWTKQTRWIVTGVITALIIANSGNNNSESSSGSNISSSSSSSSSSSKKTEMTHRCGRTWNGDRDKTYGIYGDYCCERCYADFYPN